MTEWTINSNEALTLSLVRSPADKAVLGEDETYEDFHPTFTYPIYGDDEKIYGYQDLVIDLRFASGSLATFLKVSSSATLPSSSTAAVIDDPYNTLMKFLPEDTYKTEEAFMGRAETEADMFKPYGEKVSEYRRPAPGSGATPLGEVAGDVDEVGGGDVITYEIWHATWDTPGFREYHRRMQVFILLYIEAGSYINEEEDSWEFMVLYEKRKRRDAARTETYHFMGYSSLYPFWYFPERVRLRLSQFIILPPYQHKGHGSGLYQAIYNYVLSKPMISELTVEDPAEAFEDLRDRNDLKMLLSHEQFMREAFGEKGAGVSSGGGRVARKKADTSGKKGKGRLIPPADRAWAEKWRKDLKIAGRQFSRLAEMLILLHLDSTNTLAVKAFRLQVKERLYRFNFEVLVQLEDQEKHEKLEETYQSVIEDYRRILDMVR